MPISRVSDDVEFEDPTSLWVGKDEFADMLTITRHLIESIELVTIHGEHHGEHEIVMDWTQSIATRLAPSYPIVMRFRSNIQLAPPDKTGDPERIVRCFDEWNGNALLSEKTTFSPLVGRVHQSLRRFGGYIGSWGIRNGWL